MGPFLASRDTEKVEIRSSGPLASMPRDKARHSQRGLRMTSLVHMAGQGLWTLPDWSQDLCLSIRPHQLSDDNLEMKHKNGKLGTRPQSRHLPLPAPAASRLATEQDNSLT